MKEKYRFTSLASKVLYETKKNVCTWNLAPATVNEMIESLNQSMQYEDKFGTLPVEFCQLLTRKLMFDICLKILLIQGIEVEK